MRNKKYFIFVARLAPENASIFVETRGGIRFPRVRARARTTARRREIPSIRNENKRIRYAAGRGRPALPTASSALKPNVRVVIPNASNVVIAINRINSPYTLSFRALIVKSPATETRTCVHEHSPAAVRRQSDPSSVDARQFSQRRRLRRSRTRLPQKHACAGSAPHTPVFLPFGQIEYRKVVYK